MDVLEQVRARCRAVAEESRSVRIVSDRTASYAREILALVPPRPVYDLALHYDGRAEDVVAYLVTLDSVNFGSGAFPHLAKRPGTSGYGTVARALTDWFVREGPLRADQLAAATAQDCARIFGQSLAVPPVAWLMDCFASAWNDLGEDLAQHCGGAFTTLIESAEESAARLVERLQRQPLFRDVAVYRGRPVPFYKRAQILASDLALALDGEGWGSFGDLDRLTVFADNVVPHVLRVDGLLVYDSDLAARIDCGEPIAPGSEEEIEIRACAVHAVELLVAALAGDATGGRPITARELDIALWERGRSASYKARPRHRTRTTAY